MSAPNAATPAQVGELGSRALPEILSEVSPILTGQSTAARIVELLRCACYSVDVLHLNDAELLSALHSFHDRRDFKLAPSLVDEIATAFTRRGAE